MASWPHFRAPGHSQPRIGCFCSQTLSMHWKNLGTGKNCIILLSTITSCTFLYSLTHHICITFYWNLAHIQKNELNCKCTHCHNEVNPNKRSKTFLAPPNLHLITTSSLLPRGQDWPAFWHHSLVLPIFEPFKDDPVMFFLLYTAIDYRYLLQSTFSIIII